MARDVFILGAGFSRAISTEMPLLAELSIRVKDKLNIPPSKERRMDEFGDDFEAWLTYLSTPHPWLSEAANLRNRALFFDVTSAIQSVLVECMERVIRKDPPDWLPRLIKWWRDNGSQILSLTDLRII